LSIGTETDGSIISPSQANGIVGLKPTVGLISRHGIIPVALSQDTAGPMTRTVRDAALLLDVLAGADAADHMTTTAPQLRVSYTEHLRKDGLNRARIGIIRELGEMPAVTRIIDGAVKTLKELGAEVIDPIILPKHDDYEDAEDIVLESEFKAQLPQWFAEFAPDCALSKLTDVISWNVQQAEREFKFFAQERFELAHQREDLSSQLYLDARAKCTQIARIEGIEKQLAEHRLDALVAPSGDPAWMIDLVHGDRSCFFFTSAAAVSGVPHLTVPTGFVHDLPVGLSFIGASWSESTLLKFGYAYEQATHARRSPKFKPTLHLDF
jgi:amidase